MYKLLKRRENKQSTFRIKVYDLKFCTLEINFNCIALT